MECLEQIPSVSNLCRICTVQDTPLCNFAPKPVERRYCQISTVITTLFMMNSNSLTGAHKGLFGIYLFYNHLPFCTAAPLYSSRLLHSSIQIINPYTSLPLYHQHTTASQPSRQRRSTLVWEIADHNTTPEPRLGPVPFFEENEKSLLTRGMRKNLELVAKGQDIASGKELNFKKMMRDQHGIQQEDEMVPYAGQGSRYYNTRYNDADIAADDLTSPAKRPPATPLRFLRSSVGLMPKRDYVWNVRTVEACKDWVTQKSKRDSLCSPILTMLQPLSNHWSRQTSYYPQQVRRWQMIPAHVGWLPRMVSTSLSHLRLLLRISVRFWI